MNRHPLDPLILAILSDPNVQRLHSTLREPSLLDTIALRLAANTGQSFYKIYEIEGQGISEGLTLKDRRVLLSESWGVKLSKTQNSFIASPSNIRFKGDSYLLVNNDPLSPTIPCQVLDKNLKLKGPVGARGLSLATGDYQDPVDFTADLSSNLYYITSKSDNIVQVYKTSDTSYVRTLGTIGLSGADANLLSAPVCTAIGNNPQRVYVLNNTGSPTGSNGEGFLATYSLQGVFQNINLFCGKNGGTGRLIQGEIKNPRDMVIAPALDDSKIEDIYILNGFDEIGRFRADTLELKDIYTIPTITAGQNLGLARIAVSNGILYVTSTNTGEVYAIDTKTKALVGKFGILRSEAVGLSDDTLGYFNGLSGICVQDGRVIVTESLNNRVQSFGVSLLANPYFSITFLPTRLPMGKTLVSVTYPLTGNVKPDIVLVDPTTREEFEVSTIQSLGLDNFSLRIKISPHEFSRTRTHMDIYPVYVLMENNN